jgi:hypothetical protein
MAAHMPVLYRVRCVLTGGALHRRGEVSAHWAFEGEAQSADRRGLFDLVVRVDLSLTRYSSTKRLPATNASYRPCWYSPAHGSCHGLAKACLSMAVQNGESKGCFARAGLESGFPRSTPK